MPLSARSDRRASRFPWSLALVVGAVYWAAPGSTEASAIPAQVTYATSGTIDSTGVTGAPMVQFVGASGSVASASPFSLGSFEVAPSANSQAFTHYDQTPVTISYWMEAINGTSTSASDGTPAQPMVIRGWLSGTVGGSTPSALSMVFDQGLQPDDPRFYQPRPLPPFPPSSSFSRAGGDPGSPGFLTLNDGKSALALNSTSDLASPVEAQVDLAPSVPEPSSVAIFLALGIGMAVARQFRKA